MSVHVAAIDTLRVSCLEAPPYIYSDKTLGVTGILVDFLRVAAKIADVPIEFELVNWKRAQDNVKNGRSDSFLPAVYTDERAEWVDYSKISITQFEFSIFKHKEDTLVFNGDMRVFKDQIIGKISGSKMHPTFNEEEAKKYFKVEERQVFELLAKAVQYKRLKYFVSPKEMAQWEAKKQGLYNVEAYEVPIGATEVFLPLSKKSKKHLIWEKLHQKVKELNSQGVLKEIIANYLK